MDASEPKVRRWMRRGEVLSWTGGIRIPTNNRQRTQAREIEGSRERSMMATRGTAELSDSSVRVQVTAQVLGRDCPLLE